MLSLKRIAEEYLVLKKTGFVVAAAAAGMVMFGGLASATTAGGHDDGQVGLLDLNNSDALHQVNLTGGACGNNGNVLGVQVPINEALNGLGVPVLSPGEHAAEGDSALNCASGGIEGGGSDQHS